MISSNFYQNQPIAVASNIVPKEFQIMPTPCSSVDTNEIRCRICERNYDGSQHFGIDICRACAAFFRRSVSVKKNFVCRRGSDNCHLNTPRKITCQKCRWMRCLQVGLQVELVHGTRSSHTHHSPQHNPNNTKNSDDEYDSADGSDKSIDEDEPMHIFKPIPLFMTIDVEKAHTNFIQRVLANYREFTIQRLEVEQSIPLMGDQEVILNGKKMYKTTRQRVSAIYEKQLPLLHSFLLKTFQTYQNCNEMEQKRICGLFYPVLWEIEACYWTYRHMTNENASNKLMTTQTTFIDVNDVKFWLGESESNDSSMIESQLRSLVEKARTLILRPMQSLIISEVEFAVLLALNIWAPRNHRIGEEQDRRAAEMRDRLFDDVHILYRHEMKMDNYAKRMGDIMCLYTDVQSANISETIQPILFSTLHQAISNL
ncbi:unnamed protein product [Caenorhabditis angaria]|uniref:Nuclear receptor domain-containing protein n=1 Tax=Caenorhabditis angaria TaxID=860376 RepID=A0A9P1IPU9_9PELO|nr:unnamed protein product [Caenorhabditis angaria]